MELQYLFPAHPLIILDILIKFCENVSTCFRVTDLNNRVDARVVTIYKGAYRWSYGTSSLHII